MEWLKDNIIGLVSAIGVFYTIYITRSTNKNVEKLKILIEENYNNMKKAIVNVLKVLPEKVLNKKTLVSFQEEAVFNSNISSQSPLVLNERGKRIAREIEANLIYERCNIDKSIFDTLDNPFDIQEKAFEMFNKENYQTVMDKKDIRTCKVKAYNEGQIISEITIIFAIYLRDQIIKEKRLNG